MIVTFLSEIGYGFLRLWLNPVFYFSFILIGTLAYERVQSEREMFFTRVADIVTDIYAMLVPSFIAGLVISVFFMTIGFMLPVGTIGLLMTVTFLVSLTLRPGLLSAPIVIFISSIGLLYLPKLKTDVALIDEWISELHIGSLPYFFLLLAVLLFVEAMLILREAKFQPSPRRVTGKRGKGIGGFETRRIWLVPAFVLMPGLGGLERLDWWPLFGWGDGFAFMFIPFLVGYYQFQTFDLPERALKVDGRRLMLVALVALPFAILSLINYWHLFAFICIGVLAIIRLFLFVVTLKMNDGRPAYFTKRDDGLSILGILPKSPASEMNLRVGDVICRVNGAPVSTASQFYAALQKSATYIKLDVMDENGELRFEQRAHYADDHHELGLLFVDAYRSQFESEVLDVSEEESRGGS